MDWLKDLIGNNPVVSLLFPSLLSAGKFIANLMAALSDGVISDSEFHSLMASANGVEALALLAIMYALSKRKAQ